MRRAADAESISIPDEAVALVARSATGSFRDALGTLEQLLAYSGSTIALEDVLAVLGAADADLIFGAVDAVCAGDARSALLAAASLAESGRDLGRFFGDLEAHARALMVVQVLGDVPPELRVTSEQDERLAEQAARVGQAEVVRLIELIASALRALKDGADARTQLELALVKAATPDLEPSVKALQARIARLESRPAAPAPRTPDQPQTAAGRATSPAADLAPSSPPPPPPRARRRAGRRACDAGPAGHAAPPPTAARARAAANAAGPLAAARAAPAPPARRAAATPRRPRRDRSRFAGPGRPRRCARRQRCDGLVGPARALSGRRRDTVVSGSRRAESPAADSAAANGSPKDDKPAAPDRPAAPVYGSPPAYGSAPAYGTSPAYGTPPAAPEYESPPHIDPEAPLRGRTAVAITAQVEGQPPVQVRATLPGAGDVGPEEAQHIADDTAAAVARDLATEADPSPTVSAVAVVEPECRRPRRASACRWTSVSTGRPWSTRCARARRCSRRRWTTLRRCPRAKTG